MQRSVHAFCSLDSSSALATSQTDNAGSGADGSAARACGGKSIGAGRPAGGRTWACSSAICVRNEHIEHCWFGSTSSDRKAVNTAAPTSASAVPSDGARREGDMAEGGKEESAEEEPWCSVEEGKDSYGRLRRHVGKCNHGGDESIRRIA